VHHFPVFIANVVMIRKNNEKWRMCTDFTVLNKCCPKDNFPLARIDKIVNSAASCKIMALLDCFSGYHQIWLRREDEEKTSFITLFGTYCYLRKPKGLRNASPTFCKMMKAMLKDQVGRNVLSYVDDIVVASKKKASYISDLTKTFANMRKVNLKLNPDKCVFGVTRGKMLSFWSPPKASKLALTKSKPSSRSCPCKQKGGVEVDRPHSRPKQVYCEAGRKKPPLFQHPKGLRKS
jgi:hypothetical protein